MPDHCSQEAAWDHTRDSRKHDFPSNEAIEIATLVKQVSTLKGAELIEQYGRTKRSEGAVEAAAEAINRINVAFESPLPRKGASDAQS